jgi:23S rRNA (uridine2552-2'-O)-methyltransferase
MKVVLMVKRHITQRPEKAQKESSATGFRKKSVLLKTARGRKNSSQRWLQRQLNDPYVQQAQTLGLRSRAAFKLLEINEKFDLIKPNSIIVDLGAAPGGWSQIAGQLIKKAQGKGHVFALDLLLMDALDHVTFLQGDFLDPDYKQQLRAMLPGPVDFVMSDMAAATTGHSNTDHLRTILLAETAYNFAKETLAPGGNFITKVFAGGTHKELLDVLKQDFKIVKHFKPPASRKESPETYVVCLGFRS